METTPSSSLNDVKFNNQAYLTSYLDEIIDLTEFEYKHLYTLDTSTKSFPEILALLTGRSETPNLSKLQTHQYSALVPKVRLFRVNSEDNSEYEFIFDKDHRYNILGENHIIGNNCGIKSINWILAGTNPVAAEKTIEVKIEFYFDSINSFSGGSYDEMVKFWNSPNPNLLQSQFDNETSKTTRNYWSLVYHPGLKPDEYDSTLFRVKAEVGWEQIDPNIIKELFTDKQDINTELGDSNLVMYLNLIQHNFNFNEDGSIRLTANYIASLENTFSSKRFDLLKGLKESLNKLSDYTYRSLQGDKLEDLVVSDSRTEGIFDAGGDIDFISYSQLERKIKFLTYLNNGGSLQKLQEELTACGQQIAVENLTGLDPNVNLNGSLQDIITKYESKLQQIQTAIDENSTRVKNYYYSKLIDKLIDNETASRSFYAVSLDANSVKEWLEWKNDKKPSKPSFTGQRVSTDPSSVQTALDDLDKEKEERITLRSAAEFVGRGLVAATGFGGVVASAYQYLNQNSETVLSEEEKVTDKIITFTTIGHIIDCAYRVIDGNLPKDGLDRKEFEKNKILFSTFAASLIDPNNPKIKSLASIPISVSNLVKFLDEVMYKRAATELSFFEFIKELTVKVAEPALESREVRKEEVNKYANTSISNTIISLGSFTPTIDPLSDYTKLNFGNGDATTSTKIIDLSITSKSDISDLFLTRSNIKKYKLSPFNYYIFYDRFNKDFAGNENIVEDERRGIYHYTLAQDYGLVKSINFKKIDQPFLKESKSVGKKTIYLGQFRDLYNAEIKMVGNNIYYPGMILFIKPNVEFGKVISKDKNNPTFAQITGVGGYYTVVKVTSDINDESYTTTLDCVFHSNDGLQPQEAESSTGGCSYLELEKAGLYNSGVVSGPSQILLYELKQVKSELDEQAAVKEFEQKQQEFRQQVGVPSRAG